MGLTFPRTSRPCRHQISAKNIFSQPNLRSIVGCTSVCSVPDRIRAVAVAIGLRGRPRRFAEVPHLAWLSLGCLLAGESLSATPFSSHPPLKRWLSRESPPWATATASTTTHGAAAHTKFQVTRAAPVARGLRMTRRPAGYLLVASLPCLAA